ncbi:hypothetical protein [Nannocystis punicea]|uniref:Uncharacterized protein n=1 Tax=Nannocystis punicea TaxID=2995304 RepID=A0ABY7HID2_9BACT|nr:hypothetical protein [Nannocystis poenicansa]WAS99101.1 hypothetical protein O0S08_23475 [Nannocystis poenicansa]
MQSRFCCPRCGEALTPWVRRLELAEAVNLHDSHTWVLPSGWFVRRDSGLLPAPHLSERPANYPWVFAPMSKWWLGVHSDPRRTVGCCGLASYGPELPNLVCACGQEVGLGYRDCLGPYWYSLHESVVHEQEVDPDPPRGIAERLARLRERVAGPIARMGYDPGGRHASHQHDPPSWDATLRLAEVTLDCGGGVDEPALVIESQQLPAGAQLVVPLPWCQLVRLAALGEQPWAETESPLTWKHERRGGPRVCVSRRKRRVLLTAWGPGSASWAVTIAVRAWADAWARLAG